MYFTSNGIKLGGTQKAKLRDIAVPTLNAEHELKTIQSAFAYPWHCQSVYLATAHSLWTLWERTHSDRCLKAR